MISETANISEHFHTHKEITLPVFLLLLWPLIFNLYELIFFFLWYWVKTSYSPPTVLFLCCPVHASASPRKSRLKYSKHH